MISNLSLYPPGIEEDLKIKIKDINNHIICSLCFGYFIDATSIAECLHTFCKSCIVKYLQSSKNCPTCGIRIHETQPLHNLRPDRTLQDVVYKLVPGLFENEETRREEFYRSRGVLKKKKKGEENMGPKLSTILNNPLAYQYKYDEQICLCLERYSAHQYVETHNMTYHLRSLDKKFIRCSIRVLVAHLTAIIKQKLDIPPDLKVEILCGKVPLDDEMSMKQIYLMFWYDKASPMVLFYRLKQAS